MRIVFSDLDGTLLASDKTLAPRTMAALDLLAAHGVEFVPCSGRPLVGLPPELVAHPSVHYVVYGNGVGVCRVGEPVMPDEAAQGRAASGEAAGVGRAEAARGSATSGSATPDSAAPRRMEVLRRELIDRAAVLRLYEAFRTHDVLFDVFGDGKVFSERARYDRMDTFGLDPLFVPQLRSMRTPVDVPVPELLEHIEHVERVSIYWKHREDLDLARSLVAQDDTLSLVSSQPTNVEISSARASKGAALTWLCGELDIPVAEAVAFGDSSNDCSMLEAAGDGVAMGNATPEALAASNHQTLDNDACGVAHYLTRLISN